MITDEDVQIRSLAFDKLKVLNTKNNDKRKFKVPIINFSALNYYEMIYWDKETTTMPPILSQYSIEELQSFVPVRQSIEAYPSHTQAVERVVKLVTKASENVCGHDHRDGFIKSGLLSKANLPIVETKKNFNSMFGEDMLG